ncbi:hypothetical protein ES288_A10G286500v1 [Gossypium darwinii]|uniref:TIR domain-containing protein n=1 Tax=Gossypium darwinii TaxID=34276 RepID=A0A5D2F4J5_GOSDA|nr:hypothetical protein ES288_A10G286500v1 [Gossypium darwinii]
MNVFFHDETPEQLSQPLSPAIASSSSSTRLKHQAFLSFRGEDTRLNFTAHLLKALKDKGMNVFFDEETLEKGEQLSQALSRAIAAANLSIIVLSVDYASSKSCLAELSDIMHRQDTQGHIVLPIFYHVDPSHVRNLGGSFKTSFDGHESNRLPLVQRWKAAFAEVGKLKGWHIEGGKFDRPETEYIKDIVEYVIKKLMTSKFRTASAEFVGIDYQKKTILRLIEQEDSRLIGIWGQGGIGKTTLSDVIYNEISHKFEDKCFLLNVREKFKTQGMESLRNELLSKLLNQTIHVDTPSIGSTLIQERLNNKRVLVVLDDVNDSDQIDCFGVKHFGDGSKIIVTSRDRQILKNGSVDKIHEVKKLNKNDSLQLFSTFAFKLLNPAVDFRDLSNKFVEYAQGSPLALRVLGSKLYKKSRKEWESEILSSSYDDLDEVEKNIFLDIAIFFKGTPKKDVEEILGCCYKGAVSGISNLIDKCLLDSTYFKEIDMHDMLEEMGKDIVREESTDPGKRSRLWSAKDVYQVLRYNKGTDLIQGIKLDMSQVDNLLLHYSTFEGMTNLRVLFFYTPRVFDVKCPTNKFLAHQVNSVSLLDELRYLYWKYCPFKSLSSFNPKNLVVLNLSHGDMEHLWNNDDHQVLVNLREIDISYCKNLRKIPSLLGAINLEILDCRSCECLVELPCLNHLASLKPLELRGCRNLKKLPQIPNHFPILSLEESEIEEVPDSIEHLIRLKGLILWNSKVKKVSRNISKLESLRMLDLGNCPLVEFPEIPKNLTKLNLSGTQIEEVPLSFDSLYNILTLNMSGSRVKNISIKTESLRDLDLSHCPMIEFPKIPESLRELNLSGTQIKEASLDSLGNLYSLDLSHCESLKLLSELPPYIRYLESRGCTSLEKICVFDMLFYNCFSLNQDSIDNIEANAMLKFESLLKKQSWTWEYPYLQYRLFCCFPGNKISANKFEHQSTSSSLVLKIAPNGSSGRRFLVFSICLVVDLTRCHHYSGSVQFICKYQLTAAGGGYKQFISEWSSFIEDETERKCMGDHVLILFSEDMVKKDKDYEEASFEFYIENPNYKVEEGEEIEDEYIKVDKCGVHISYVDEEPSTNPTT